MRAWLKNPTVNAVCIGLFTAFYAAVFIVSSGSGALNASLYYNGADAAVPFWTAWSRFLEDGRHVWIACVLICVTICVIALLLMRRRPYDEYHIACLMNCLAAAAVLTLAAIALFYLAMLGDARGMSEKFTLFIVIHWASVVLANLVFALISRWR